MSYISASQIGTYEDCNRFWHLQRILKLQEPPATHFTFGTVLHAVNERYLSADKNQRVPKPANDQSPGVWTEEQWAEGPLKGQNPGRPVNLYPPGWDTATERDGSEATVTSNEAKLIKKLVEESILNGVLRWREHTQVERKVLAQVIKGVQLIGYIDAFKPPTDVQPLPIIEDHKSYGKGSLRFLKRENSDSPNFLGKDQQLLTYCWATSELDGWTGDVTVRHNQYPKFPDKDVTSVEATIPRAAIVAHGEYLRDVAARMERTRKIKEWSDVSGPKDTGKCARWYGKPCPFSDICGRAETPDAYQARLERLKSGSKAARLNLPLAKPKKRTGSKDNNMSIFDRANKQKSKRTSARAAAGTKEARAAVDAPSVNGDAPETVTTIEGGAPWSNPECKACKGRGFTSKNKACPICDNTAKRGKRPTSMSYVVEEMDEGLMMAVARAEAVEELEAAGMPLEWEESEAPQEAAPAPAAEKVPTPAPEAKAQEATEEAPVKPARRKRRTKAEIAADKAAKAEAKQAALDVEVAEGGEGDPDPEPKPNPRAVAQPQPKAKRGAGRPNVGLTIMVGAMYMSGQPGGRPVITSSQALARFGAELAEDMGAESYYDLDSFKRRERLAQKADYIASALAKHILVHPGILGNDDEGKLMQALMGLSEGIDAVIVRVS